MPQHDFITADAVAQILDHASAASFLAARKRLERDHDFPLPMPTCLRPLKWRRAGVVAWVQSQGRAASQAPAPTINERTLMREARTA